MRRRSDAMKTSLFLWERWQQLRRSWRGVSFITLNYTTNVAGAQVYACENSPENFF